jgi:hypothetical protein
MYVFAAREASGWLARNERRSNKRKGIPRPCGQGEVADPEGMPPQIHPFCTDPLGSLLEVPDTISPTSVAHSDYNPTLDLFGAKIPTDDSSPGRASREEEDAQGPC